MKNIEFSEKARSDIKAMRDSIIKILNIAKDAFENLNKEKLPELIVLENEVDRIKKELTRNHFSRLAEGNCAMEVSPYYSSAISGLERVADHLVNIGYSIINRIGSEKES